MGYPLAHRVTPQFLGYPQPFVLPQPSLTRRLLHPGLLGYPLVCWATPGLLGYSWPVELSLACWPTSLLSYLPVGLLSVELPTCWATPRPVGLLPSLLGYLSVGIPPCWADALLVKQKSQLMHFWFNKKSALLLGEAIKSGFSRPNQV